MSFAKWQFRHLIDRVLSRYPELVSEAAVRLLLGTAAQESAFGTYLRQKGSGPALGVFQMEPATFFWLRDKYKDRYPVIADRVPPDMEWDLRLAIIMARLRYRIVPAPLPEADDITALANYYKKYYNTVHGKATTEQFISNYRKYLG